MNIFVIIKRTFDTEEKISISGGHVNADSATFIINPYDEYAIEEALKLKEEHGGEVTLVTFGEEKAEKELRTGLAMGADKAVLIRSDDLENKDQSTTTAALAAYLKDQEIDIILAGNVTVDGGTGQVGPRIAEELNIPAVTVITKLTIDGDKAVIERDVEGNLEIVETSLPVLVTCQQGLNEPRYPSLPGIMKAKKKPLEVLDLDDLGIDEDEAGAKTKSVDIFLPPAKAAGKVLQGDPSQQVHELLTLLRTEAKVI